MIKILAAAFILFFASCAVDRNDVDAVKNVLNQYNTAMQKLDTTGAAVLYTDSSIIVESGSVEGTYKHYDEHHIGPELSEFHSLTYSDYKVNVTIDGNYAFATEEFKYQIVDKATGEIFERDTVTTSLLKKVKTKWKIKGMHFSSHK